MPKRYSCVLLMTDRSDLADAAEAFARERFDVRYTSRHSRNERKFPQEAASAIAQGSVDLLLNYLAPMYVPKVVLQAIQREAINFHPAPPAWPGIGSASYALYRGDPTFGATAHRMTTTIDGGEIVGVAQFSVCSEDTCESLFSRALRATLDLFFEVCQELTLDGHAVPTGDHWERAAVTRAEFERWMTLAPTDSPDQIARKMRALKHPRFPGPFFEINGVRMEVPKDFDPIKNPDSLSSLWESNGSNESNRGPDE